MVYAESSFVWNDGRSPFTVRQSHLFAVKGEKGVVVGKSSPNASAALSIKGALRIQFNESKNTSLGAGIDCSRDLAGTVKTVEAVYNAGGNNGQYCPCLCNGKNWTPILTTPQCTNACEGRKYQPDNDETPTC
jgi:hypothetical protein